LDEILIFKPLSKENIRAIASLAIEDLSRRLAERRLSLSVTDRAIEHIIEAAYDPIFGARPLKRYIKSKTETLLARKILSENPAPDTEFLLDCDEDGLKIQ
jgi:ATP-dependent Clp protease ATP-binding subunit ClpB